MAYALLIDNQIHFKTSQMHKLKMFDYLRILYLNNIYIINNYILILRKKRFIYKNDVRQPLEPRHPPNFEGFSHKVIIDRILIPSSIIIGIY